MLAPVIGVCLALLAALPVLAASKPYINSEKIQADITTSGLMSHIVALDDIATANNGNRAFGLPGYAASVDYIWERVSNIPGTRAWKQDFYSLFDQVLSIDFRVDGQPVHVVGLSYSPSTSEEGITAQLVHGPEGEAGCYDESYRDLDVKGKIVLIQRWLCPQSGNTTLAGRIFPAARAGASAVIIYQNVDVPVSSGTLTAPDPEHVPVGFINLSDGLSIKEWLESGGHVQAYFQHTQIVEQRLSQNVFVETEDGDPDNVIILGAHLDSVQEGPGMNDNASGSSLVLEVFRAATKYRTRNKIRFAWWGGEENGLVGSRYYCTGLRTSEVESILVYLNFDMVSRGYFGIGDGDGSLTGVPAPSGSDVIERIYTSYFKSKGLEPTEARFTNGSDYASFWKYLNKPIGYLHTGTGEAQDPCYHQACDTIGNVNPQILTINAKVRLRDSNPSCRALTGFQQAAAYMLSVLSTDGSALIRKQPANATILNSLRVKTLNGGFDVDHQTLEVLGQRHVGCGLEI